MVQAAAIVGKEDTWVSTACQGCFCQCGIRVHRIGNVVTEIEGDPECPINWGKLCAKGKSRIMTLYDPRRVTKPMIRTNPEKGIGVDPKWKEIGWEEAIEMVAQKLKKIRAEDPRKLVISMWDHGVFTQVKAWGSAFGTPNTHWTGYYCGNSLHPVTYVINGTFHTAVDLDHCNYVIMVGSQHGFMAGANPNLLTQKMAQARARGLKVVSIDPVGTNAVAKADEWVPIRPGTDGAFAMAMLNVLLNELGVYDREYLKYQTNGIYLTKADGTYVREQGTEKPLVWDLKAGKAPPYAEIPVGWNFKEEVPDPALEGTFTVDGVECAPAFQRLKDHVKEWTPEKVEPITTIPAETIRRLTADFAREVRIGSTIVIDGKLFPYRPAAMHIYRGAYAHKHGVMSHLALQLINFVVGSLYSVGGSMGAHPVGPYWSPTAGVDGMITAAKEISHSRLPYPPSNPVAPTDLGLMGIFPMANNISPAVQLSIMNPDWFKFPYLPEMLINCRTNLMMSRANPKSMEETLKKIPFIVTFAYELNETAEFADLVFPDAHELERMDMFPNTPHMYVNPNTDFWYWGIRQEAVKPPPGVKHWVEVMVELAKRAGFLEDYFRVLNVTLHLKEPYTLKPGREYSWDEVADTWARSQCGPDKGLDWFKKNGLIKEQKKVDQMYPRPTIKGRFPVYFEFFTTLKPGVEKVAKELGLKWDTSDYVPLPVWRPCSAYSENGKFDLFAVNFKGPFHCLSVTMNNPWLHDLSQMHPYADKILLNTESAKKRGIKTGDTVCIESEVGKVQGKVRVTECIHPEVIGIPGIFGHWAEGKPVGRGNGAHFNALIPFSLEKMDMISTGLDGCVKVRVTKA